MGRTTSKRYCSIYVYFIHRSLDNHSYPIISYYISSMSINLEGIVLFAFGIMLGIIGYFQKRMFDQQDEVARKLVEHELDNANNLIRKEDYQRDVKEIKEKLDKIYDHFIKRFSE